MPKTFSVWKPFDKHWVVMEESAQGKDLAHVEQDVYGRHVTVCRGSIARVLEAVEAFEKCMQPYLRVGQNSTTLTLK